MSKKITPHDIVERSPLIYVQETKERVFLDENPELLDLLAKRVAKSWVEQAEYAVEASINGD